ncbi:putative 6-O-methylguanine DNA methyltransferase [Rosellinia necatrix]|uniref:Putative 6-O-methylguanine DNA methyltransferase n=1 Tax=Rosellinia necatrix TaxID=77044 RepID=A0A1W2TG39_ROSNE|nr:putative 6-O-methylguanine DNA methyltransferase [Rosellinia necatrix]
MARMNAVAIPRDKLARPARPTSSSTDEARWRLVLAHTPTPDFLYAVLSTGIFCRPSCPSRRPRRANVRFFDSAASAAAAGFRACRRCRPESGDASHESPQASAEKQVGVACEYVRRRKGEAQLTDIAAHVGLSSRYLHGLFKQVMGTTPGAYAAAVRQESAAQQSAPMTPVAAAPDTTVRVAESDSATTPAEFPLIDDTTCGLLFIDSSQLACGWLPEASEFGCTDFDQHVYPEWLNDCTLDDILFSGTNGESIEPQLDICSTSCIDPCHLTH